MPAQGTAPLIAPERPNRPGATPRSHYCQPLNQETADARLPALYACADTRGSELTNERGNSIFATYS